MMYNMPFITDEIILILEDDNNFYECLKHICRYKLGFHSHNVIRETLLDNAKKRVRQKPVPDIVLYDLADERSPTDPIFGLDELDNFEHLPLIIVTIHVNIVEPIHRTKCFWVIKKPDTGYTSDVERFSDELQLAVRAALALKQARMRWHHRLRNWLGYLNIGLHIPPITAEYSLQPQHENESRNRRIRIYLSLIPLLIMLGAVSAMVYTFGVRHTRPQGHQDSSVSDHSPGQVTTESVTPPADPKPSP